MGLRVLVVLLDGIVNRADGSDAGGGDADLQPVLVGDGQHHIELERVELIRFRRDGDALAAVLVRLVLHHHQELPLEVLSFSDDQSPHFEFCDNAIYLNPVNEIESSEERFLIMTDDFLVNFDEVWAKWRAFYSKKYIPTLFYEFICNKNLRVNKFLNFVQAVEIFSNHYRNKEAQDIAIRNGWKVNTNRPLPLKFRIEEIITFLNEFFHLSPEEIS